jgi:hypothetical protein
VTLFQDSQEQPKSKTWRYIIGGTALAVAIGLLLWYSFRFTPEKDTVQRFMDAVVAGNMQQAYQIWKPRPNFTYQDFLSFWGPKGYYSPIKSYKIDGIDEPPHGASGVIVEVEISSYSPFPSAQDKIKSAQSRDAQIWVEKSDHSLSFPPP